MTGKIQVGYNCERKYDKVLDKRWDYTSKGKKKDLLVLFGNFFLNIAVYETLFLSTFPTLLRQRLSSTSLATELCLLPRFSPVYLTASVKSLEGNA